MPLSLIGQQIGNYRIVKSLGEGGMGAVYLGEHPLIGKKVAIKVLREELSRNPEIVSRFFTEAKAVNDIGHPGIVDIVDFGQTLIADQTLVYLTMELLDGESLRARLDRGGLPQAEALGIAVQCAAALAASHQKGIVHRDLKPDNIFLLRRGDSELVVKLLDFGIAKLTGGAEPIGHQTRAGSLLGTPAYMAPEQCDGRGDVDHRADIYALGMVLYEMLCGRTAFVTPGFGEMLVQQMTHAPPPPSRFALQLRPELEALVLRCLEKDRQARFQTMEELGVVLRAVAPRITGQALAPGSRSGASPVSRPGVAAPSASPPRPTTLSSAPGEAPSTQEERSGRVVLLLGITGMLLVFLAGGAGFVVSLRQRPTQVALPPLPPPLTTVQPADDAIPVLIDSTPQGARVLRAGGSPLGTTPLRLRVRRDEPGLDVTLELEGYQSTTVTVGAAQDHVEVALEKREPAPAPAPSARPAAAGAQPPAAARERPSSAATRKGSSKRPDARPGSDPDAVLAPSL